MTETKKHRIINRIINRIYEAEEKKGLFFIDFLWLLSVLFGCVVRIRRRLYKSGLFSSKHLDCITLSIGNISVGGTGKTPTTIYIARRVSAFGYRPVVLSRGYKGTAQRKGGIVSDGQTLLLDHQAAGDEPVMTAEVLKDVPVVVHKNRIKGGRSAVERFQPDIIILDDAFQHFKLKRDIDLVLLDRRRPFGNGRLLPRGSLREPPSALSRAHGFILTHTAKEPNPFPSSLDSIIGDKPVFYTDHVPYLVRQTDKTDNRIDFNGPSSTGLDRLQKKKIVAFSGIAFNQDFRETLEKLGTRILAFWDFPDHFAYDKAHLDDLSAQASEKEADYIVTTHKDYVRLLKTYQWPVPLAVIGIAVSFGQDAERFDQFLKDRLAGLSAGKGRVRTDRPI